MKLIFNYNDVFFSFYYDDLSGCVHRSREYALNYVYSGEMVLDCGGNEKVHVRKGECVFIPRDYRITMYKKTYNGERYCGIFLMFTRAFLRQMYGLLGRGRIHSAGERLRQRCDDTAEDVGTVVALCFHDSVYRPDVKPKDDFMKLKLQGGTYGSSCY